jgi:hypothetical protein
MEESMVGRRCGVDAVGHPLPKQAVFVIDERREGLQPIMQQEELGEDRDGENASNIPNPSDSYGCDW